MTPMTPEQIAEKLTKGRREEILHYTGDQWRRPKKIDVAYRLWQGVFHKGQPIFLLQRLSGCCQYRLNDRGREVREALIRSTTTHTNRSMGE